MSNKDYLKKIYKQFSEFIGTASARELEYFILDARYSANFNKMVKELFDELREAELSVIFDTEGEIVLIDADIVGKFIADNYKLSIEKYYKDTQLNRIVKEVVNGSRKSQADFVRISFSILYNTVGNLYTEIKCKKDIIEKYREKFYFMSYSGEDIPIIIITFLILEDVSAYIHIAQDVWMECIRDISYKKCTP